MTASPLCCFRLEATRGPHSGMVLRHCRVDAAAPYSPACALSIGRKKRCWLRLPKDLEVSSVHAEFRFIESETKFAIRDAKSTNGTKLNGKQLQAQQDYPLSNGDLIAVGRTSLRFVQVVHGQPCDEETDNISAGASAILTPSDSSSEAQSAAVPEVIVLDEDSAEDKETASNTTGSNETPVDQPDTEPAHDVLALKPSMVAANDAKGKRRTESVVLEKAVSHSGNRIGAVGEYTPEEAMCTVCRVVIGQLDMLEQQAHLNECLGGRVAAPSTASATTTVKDSNPNTRKRGNAGGAATRAKKPRKPKAGEDNGASATVAPKAKKPRKRKRADAGESIELALALTGKKMSKEEQTDVQLAVTKKKLEQIDEQIAKLAKRRVNLVKTLDRLERTKDKLRKSQVLPPAKVVQLLDLKAALDVIFPSNRQSSPVDRSVNKGLQEKSSVVAKRYAPSRWRENRAPLDCDEEKQAELAAVAEISMWARASQQLFGLQRDTLLYRNSILRTFLGDDDDADGRMMDLDNADDLDYEDGDAEFEREDESEEKQKLKISPPDHQSDADVPDVVKRVFPNWQCELAFLHDQTAEELERAVEAMNESQTQADAVAIDEGESIRREGSHSTLSEEHSAANSEVATSKSDLSAQEEQRLACQYMAQMMIRLIAEKRRRAIDAEAAEGFHHRQQQERRRSVIDLVASSGEEVGQQEQTSDIIVASDNEAE
ncbi:hypothetical protein PC129_g13475 [Phytophthora cactorum]|uniref:FHA domain-containing protein n=1 Tax=Phytophthora cactorum TaxID=29920 RepID=A0A329T284_9STRA|nr:hypothetical protein Pcac1_g23783 [Phytophthora cactorum]KAG2832371.1 hypothetical protein PC111_g6625 [Phytophthora cactorum]KAG2848498.1 hypothetical protein PC112_g655 [Phytophthora cactorum]KAG2868644.1 hypothetical protein PC113_g843 [Phytophthora cactorum]KAG2921644.1 hypothetical protein PC117_g16154 [Phytophthora cactorum]